jgi:hypothetical protein
MSERSASVVACAVTCALLVACVSACAPVAPARLDTIPAGALIAIAPSAPGAAIETSPTPGRASDLRPGQRIALSETALRLLPRAAEGIARAEVVSVDARTGEFVLRVEAVFLRCGITPSQLPLVLTAPEGSLLRVTVGEKSTGGADPGPAGHTSDSTAPGAVSALRAAIGRLQQGDSATFRLRGGSLDGEPYLEVRSVGDVSGSTVGGEQEK